MFKLKRKNTTGLTVEDMVKATYSEVVGQNEVEEVMINHKMKPMAGIFKGIIEIFKEMGKQGVPAFAGLDDKKGNAIFKAILPKIKLSDFFDTAILQTEQIIATNKKTQIQSQEMYESLSRSRQKDWNASQQMQMQPQQMPPGMTMGQPQYQQYPQQQVPGMGAIGTFNNVLGGVSAGIAQGGQVMQQGAQMGQMGQNMAQNPMGQPMPQQQYSPYNQQQYGQQMPQQKPVNNFDNMTLE